MAQRPSALGRSRTTRSADGLGRTPPPAAATGRTRVRGVGWLLAWSCSTRRGGRRPRLVLCICPPWSAPPPSSASSPAPAPRLPNLLRPLLGRMDDLTLALRIEERYPSLNDSLASTDPVPRAGREEGRTGETGPAVKDSPAMRREAVRRAMKKAEGCDFNRIIDTPGPARRRRPAGSPASPSPSCSSWSSRRIAMTAMARLADPFGAHRWPTATDLELEPHRTRIGRNEAFEVGGTCRGVIPEKARRRLPRRRLDAGRARVPGRRGRASRSRPLRRAAAGRA